MNFPFITTFNYVSDSILINALKFRLASSNFFKSFINVEGHTKIEKIIKIFKNFFFILKD